MNTRFLVLTSFLIALLCHLFIFSYCIVVFPIDPETPKPKFFFLGSILKHSDIKQIAAKETASKNYIGSNHHNLTANDAIHMQYEPTDPNKNPFTIQAIRKPLTLQTVKSEEKVILKATFEASLEKDRPKEMRAKTSNQELDIRPYKPLRFRAPENKRPEI